MIEFSVVIAVYNKEKYLAKTLESVLNQSYSNFELILVNDGATDGSIQIIETYLTDPRIQYIQQENHGAAAARNAGIKAATKPYIALLDADDIWFSNHLECLVTAIQEFPDEFVFATNSVVKYKGRTLKRSYSVALTQPIQKVDFFEASCIDSIVNSSSIVIATPVFKTIGNFSVDLVRTEDTDLWIRIGSKYQIVFNTKETVQVNRDSLGLSNKIIALKNKMNFANYAAIEQESKAAKKFCDLNRYALALEAKLDNDTTGFKQLFNQIDIKNLNTRQRMLLGLSPSGLKFIYILKEGLSKLGINLSANK